MEMHREMHECPLFFWEIIGMLKNLLRLLTLQNGYSIMMNLERNRKHLFYGGEYCEKESK